MAAAGRASFRKNAFLYGGALAVVGGFLSVTQMSTPRRATVPARVTLSSLDGAPLTSFFEGLHPIPAYSSGRMFPKTGPLARRDCGKRPGLLSRLAASVGLATVVHAQGACSSPCQACYRAQPQAPCPGSCVESDTYDVAVYGGLCNDGMQIAGPACEQDGSCYCNEVVGCQSNCCS